MVPARDRIRVALAGNPNSGKTTIFNALTGARQHVGNYPGVTVEKREGSCSYHGKRFELIDLPGTYSLSSYSPDERVARDELLDEDLDVVVVVVDSTALKRSLVLLVQTIQTGANPVLCLNMADEAQKSRQRIELKLLESLLRFPVVETIGHMRVGIESLKGAIEKAATVPVAENRLVLGERLEGALEAITGAVSRAGISERAAGWVATRLLLGDKVFTDMVLGKGDAGSRAIEEAERQRQALERESNTDAALS